MLELKAKKINFNDFFFTIIHLWDFDSSNEFKYIKNGNHRRKFQLFFIDHYSIPLK